MEKAEVARRQLGTALHLFIADDDPVSVHVLACGGGEISESLARKGGQEPFTTHILETVPDIDPGKIRALRNQFWNAFKHSTTRKGVDREDASLLARFDDEQNDHALFIGWYDYMNAVGTLPLEAQVFQVWYFAKYPDKLNPAADFEFVSRAFPRLDVLERRHQKLRLRATVRRYSKNRDVVEDPRTDRRRLVLR